ncbi:MAG: EpsI family protein [Syntrophaceae bacterium]|nr:EpsI family protein [Syntrophaceae bacterium]
MHHLVERYNSSVIPSTVLIQRHLYYILPFSALAIVFFETIIRLVRGWFTYDGSHGLLIFAFGVYIFWVKRHEVAQLTVEPSPWSGTALSLLGGLGYLAGRFTGTWSLEGISLIVTILGMVLLLGGKKILFFFALPVGYTIFMFPFFDELLGGISIPLQLITAWIASNMLRVVGMPALLSDQYITLPHINLEVAKACNGINHITALLAITIPFSYFVHRSWYKRATLVVSAVVIGIVLNGIRVASIGVITSFQKEGPLHGPSDVFYVSFIFFSGLLIQFLISHMIGRDAAESEKHIHMRAERDGDRSGSEWTKKEITALSLAMGTVASVGLGLVFWNPQPAALASPLDTIPFTIGTYEGRDATNKSGSFKGMDLGTELFRRYEDADSGAAIYLYVGYMPIQNYERKITNYPSEALLARSINLDLLSGGEPVRIRWAVLSDAGVHRTVYYWYVIGNQIVAERAQAKWVSLIEAFKKRKTAAAIVIVSSEKATIAGDDVEHAHTYVEEIIPIVKKHLN